MSASVWQTPLSDFQASIAAPQPAPAGVAVACVNATLALSLLVKVLRITGKRPDLLDPALKLIAELRATADADVAAIHTYIETRDTQPMKEVPSLAAHRIAEALLLSAAASESVTGLIAADVAATTELLQGAAAAINACISANRG